MPEIDTFNRWMVGIRNDGLYIGNPPMRGEYIHPDAAMVLAAYLVSLADPAGERFKAVLEAVQGA